MGPLASTARAVTLPSRRNIFVTGMSSGLMALSVSGTPASALSAMDMEDAARNASISGIEQSLSDHRYTVTDLASYYVARIGTIDRNGPSLHSIIEVNPEWESLARGMDNEVKGSGGPAANKPLFGIPIVLKDNIDTADRMQ